MICTEDHSRVSQMIKSLDGDDLKRIEMNDKSSNYFEEVGLTVYLVKEEDSEIGFFGVYGLGDYCQTPLFIKKEYRSKGYGKRLVDMAEAVAFEQGYFEVLHRIKKDNNRMMALSKSCGYSHFMNDRDYWVMSKERGL